MPPTPQFRRVLDINELALADDDVTPPASFESSADGLAVCEPLRIALEEPALPLVYNRTYREVGIAYAESFSKVVLAVCPFCGDELPSSLRDAWFDELDRLELEPEDDAVPDSLRTDAWWRSPRDGLAISE